MTKYFEENESIYSSQGKDILEVLKTVSNKYLGSHPAQPLTFKLINENNFKKNSDYRFDLDLGSLFPNAKKEQSAYVWSQINWMADGEFSFLPTPYGPMRIFINGELAYKSNSLDEENPDKAAKFTAKLKKGPNNIVFQFIKTTLGFGGMFTSEMYKGGPLRFMVPSAERKHEVGFLYTAPMDGELATLPSLGTSETSHGIKWYPELNFTADELSLGQFGRIYGVKEGRIGFAYTKAEYIGDSDNYCTIKGNSEGAVKLYVDGAKIFESGKAGNFEKEIKLKIGVSDILIKTVSGKHNWGFNLEIISNSTVKLSNPSSAVSATDPWLFIGPFAKDFSIPLTQIDALDIVFETENGRDYWRIDKPGIYIRPYLETELYGHWDYPLGVTMYGMLQTALLTNRTDIVTYIKKHIEISTAFFNYSLWDKEKYGYDGFNSSLCDIVSLDDCGSFASMMLELSQYESPKDYRIVADYVADYITNKQVRLEDGAFYRINPKHIEMVNTMWVDDLYMSTPFLSRYYRLTGEQKYIDDAAKQFILYMKYLWVPELKLCAHVYYTDKKVNTGIPWGRGNGWVLFSLSELLAIMPEDHAERPDMLELFNKLCEGYLARQDEDGMWHQVLNDFDSYQESSCTSMFIYAFSRGIRMGFLKDTEKYKQSVYKGWQALTRIAIDKAGNIYGICRGSGHSFTPRYYKYELSWQLNNTHGIGVILLAGIEALKLENFLAE